jgi:hypothetical protein
MAGLWKNLRARFFGDAVIPTTEPDNSSESRAEKLRHETWIEIRQIAFTANVIEQERVTLGSQSPHQALTNVFDYFEEMGMTAARFLMVPVFDYANPDLANPREALDRFLSVLEATKFDFGDTRASLAYFKERRFGDTYDSAAMYALVLYPQPDVIIDWDFVSEIEKFTTFDSLRTIMASSVGINGIRALMDNSIDSSLITSLMEGAA